MKSEIFGLIVFTAVPSRFETGAGRRGETERAAGDRTRPSNLPEAPIIYRAVSETRA